MRLYLRVSLEREGFDVTEAATLREARNCLRMGCLPTSVLLDLELPDGHGLDIIRELPPGVPVVVLSADDSRETELQCRQAGCAAVLSKSERFRNPGQVMAEMEGNLSTAGAAPRRQPELASKYQSFLAEARIDLQRARDRHDFDRARRIAHRLRGTAVHFGYSGISASARAIGQALASGDVDRIESTLEELIERLLDAAQSHLAH